jgi:two-component system, cell cycle sensor histidine kinase and response regulator CckA
MMWDTQPLRFLLIDDDADDRKRLAHRLRKGFPGAVVLEITGKQELNRAIAQHVFDVVLSEYQLEWSDGLKVLKSVRRCLPYTPVIWVSSARPDEAIAAGMKAGLNDYVSKQQLQRLLKAIRDSWAQAIQCQHEAHSLQALRAAEQRYRVLSELTSDYAYLLRIKTDGSMVCEWVNEGFTAITGYTLEALARPGDWTSFIHAEDVSIVSQRLRRWMMGQTDISEFRIITQHGEERWFRDYTCPVRDEHEARIVRVYGAGQEVTERRRLEEPLRQSQKMEAIGRLAGGIAHDFNNLLQVISGYSDMLQRRLTRHSTLCRYVQEIKNVAEQGAMLTRQLMMVNRKPSFQPQVVDFKGIISNIAPMLRRLLGEDIELITSVTPGLGQVTADPGQLEQVILNLAVNARDAMPQGGRLTLEATNVKLDAPLASRMEGVAPGEYIKLMVGDTGSGMDADTLAHIFEPFFTTKAPGKGTGLGLFTVYGIVSQNGGHMQVQSTPGVGTTFTVHLPRVDAPIEAIQAEPAPQPALHGGETILLVEDEPVVRDLIRQVLHATGYEVLEATTGEQALHVSSAHRGPIHLLLADVVLPGLSGPEVAAQLGSTRPNIQLIYISGYAPETVQRYGISDKHCLFLQKPFTPTTLLATVRQALDAAQA